MTPQEQIERQLRDCEKKFLDALQECPLAVTLTSAIDHRYIEVNNTFERISGWKRNEVIGRTPFDINIWVNPSDRLDYVKRLLSGGTVRDFEVRARMKDREVRVGLGYGALIEVNGETCLLSLIAVVTDVKGAEEAKQAEVVLSGMARRLIQAHEEERASVARALHEYVDRLLLLSTELDRASQKSPQWVSERNQQITDAKREIEDLTMDIQNLSHRLRSSKLEYLGLAAAAASFCKELSDEKKVEIDFTSEEIPEHLPQDVSLSLFRVLQGALQNALSHGGSQRLEVLLKGGSNEVFLTVRDSGIGFDLEDVAKAPRLDLAIMKEQLAMVGGEFSIQSQRGKGTTIQACVPLTAKSGSAEATG
ncbi:MAG TPA: ATP-binding protein [Terriglobales bacterium]|nr:ATP-binding protein [Terriglobales bacterium]